MSGLGYLTKTKPVSPNLAISVAAVINAHASTGTLFIRPTWADAISDLSDVNGTEHETTGQILVWDNTAGYFDATANINDYVTTVGTPVNNELGVWTGDGTLEGESNLTFD